MPSTIGRSRCDSARAARRPAAAARAARASSSGVGSNRAGSGSASRPGEPEEALEQGRRAIDGGAEARAPGLLDQPALGEGLHRRLRGDAADARDLGTRDRLQVGDDRQRLGLRLGQRRGLRPRQQPPGGLARRPGARRACGPRRPRAGRRRGRRASRRADRAPDRPRPRSRRRPRPAPPCRPAPARGTAAPRRAFERTLTPTPPALKLRSWRADRIGPNVFALLPGRLAPLVQLEQREQRHRLGQPVLGAEGLVEIDRGARRASSSRTTRRRRSSETVGRMWLVSGRGGVAQQVADRRRRAVRAHSPGAAASSATRRSSGGSGAER